jgi:hypothetical protein
LGTSDGPYEVAVSGEDLHSVAADVDTVQQTVDAQRDGVRHRDGALAERAYEGAILLEDDDRVVAATRAIPASKEVHAPIRVDRNARHVAKRPALGQSRPVLDFAEHAAAWPIEGFTTHGDP